MMTPAPGCSLIIIGKLFVECPVLQALLFFSLGVLQSLVIKMLLISLSCQNSRCREERLRVEDTDTQWRQGGQEAYAASS
jgi:hypothetical protein